MSEENKINLTLAIKIILLILLLIFLYFVRDAILILMVSYILATIFLPVVDWFQKKGIARPISTVIIYLILLAIFIGTIILIVPIFKNELSFFNEKFLSFQAFIQMILSKTSFGGISLAQIWQQGFLKIGQGLFSLVSNTVDLIFIIILIVTISFYFIVDKNVSERFFISLFPKKYHQFINKLIVLSQENLSRWGWGILLVILLTGLLLYFSLLIFNIHGALFLAILGAFLGIIPLVGPYFAAFPAVILGILDSPIKALVVVIIYLIVFQLKDSILVPQVMKKTVGLNPVIVILAILVGVKLGGILGAIIAIPVAAMVYIFIEEYLELKKQQEINK